MGEENCLSNITTSLNSMNLDDEDDYSSSSNVSSPSISSSPSSSTTKKQKKPRKNKPTNLILGAKQPDTIIPAEIIKIAEEKYIDEAVKINDGTFRFGDQIVIGQDGIQQSTISKLHTPSSGSSSEQFRSSVDFSTSPSNISSISLVNNEHMIYEDLEEVCKLGRGASSTVYKVMHKKTNQVYAMKKINVDLNDQKPKLIVSEFKALYNNDCPYVMTLYDAYYRQGCILMVLKFMDCGSLEDVLSVAGRIPESVLSRICEQLLLGLEYLHTVKKIVHRDIKPANVLVHNTGEVCIADFGMAGLEKSQKYVQSLQQTCKFDTYCGTHAYMSVERIRGQPHSYDSDIWSFGLTMAEAFLGVFPFVLSANASIWDMLNFMEKSSEAPFPLEGASSDFKDFIYSTLRVNRKERPSATSLLQHPFITKYRHKKPQFLEKWIYYSYIAPRQLAKMNISFY